MSDRLTLAQLGEIEQRAEQATDGPWIVDGAGPGEMGVVMVRPEHGDYVTANFGINRAYNGGWDNAEFIAHSRGDIPTLTAELRRAWEALAEIEQIAGYYAMGFYCQWCDKLVPEKEQLVHHDNCPHFVAHKALPEDWPK